MAVSALIDASKELLERMRSRSGHTAIIASLQSSRAAVFQASNSDLNEIRVIREEVLRNIKKEGATIQLNEERKELLRQDPKKVNLVFLDGKTLGCYLKENLSPEEQVTLFQKIGTSKAQTEEFLQDKNIPETKEVDTILLKYLNDKFGLGFVDYTIYKANTHKNKRRP